MAWRPLPCCDLTTWPSRDGAVAVLPRHPSAADAAAAPPLPSPSPAAAVPAARGPPGRASAAPRRPRSLGRQRPPWRWPTGGGRPLRRPRATATAAWRSTTAVAGGRPVTTRPCLRRHGARPPRRRTAPPRVPAQQSRPLRLSATGLAAGRCRGVIRARTPRAARAAADPASGHHAARPRLDHYRRNNQQCRALGAKHQRACFRREYFCIGVFVFLLLFDVRFAICGKIPRKYRTQIGKKAKITEKVENKQMQGNVSALKTKMPLAEMLFSMFRHETNIT